VTEYLHQSLEQHKIIRYNIMPFWDDAYTQLEYINELFNDSHMMETWVNQGYTTKFSGDMCDMRRTQPSWNQRFVDLYSMQGWKNIGTSYYRMNTATCIPVHNDLYKKYIDLYQLHGQEHRIRRAIVFLEDWKSGHYFESMNMPMTNWTAGTVVEWTYDTPHMAANMGLEPRYTLQITGFV
jgi:hypothetical protein